MRWRLVAAFVGITIVVLAAHDIPLAAHLRAVERDRIVTALERDAFVLAGRSEEALESGTAADRAALQQLVDGYRATGGARVVVTDRNGRAEVISDEEVTQGSSYASRPEIGDALTGRPVAGERASVTLGMRLLYVAVPVLSGADVVGAVRLTFPAAEIGHRVASRVRGLLLVAVISVVTAAAAAALLAGAITRPIRRLRRATDRLGAGDLSAVDPVGEGPREIRELGASFGRMARRVGELVEEQRAFAGDASHQLRTPLTALRLRLEQASDLVERDPAEARARIDAATAETERMQHLVDGLLALARAEGRDEPLQSIDVARIARERAELWRPLAEEHAVEIEVHAPDAAPAAAVAGAVEQIVDNYVDNALAAMPDGGTLQIVVERVRTGAGRAAAVDVHVLDTGPGMTDDQLARAFDRFWRGPATAAAGSGLGLAIVAQLARASRAEATIGRRPTGGTDAAIRLEASAAGG